MMMLAWRHRLFDIATSFREGSWSWSPMVGGAVRGEIGGQTVGVVGLGHIGREVAWRAAALGCGAETGPTGAGKTVTLGVKF
jgi:phosphoglycerate dehydrogenase-like enzyme